MVNSIACLQRTNGGSLSFRIETDHVIIENASVAGGWRVPTVLRIGAYRLFFYSGDQGEPKHVHVERDESIAKFWLEPLRLQRSGGFSRMEIRRIERIIQEHHSTIVEAWNEYFGS